MCGNVAPVQYCGESTSTSTRYERKVDKRPARSKDGRRRPFILEEPRKSVRVGSVAHAACSFQTNSDDDDEYKGEHWMWLIRMTRHMDYIPMPRDSICFWHAPHTVKLFQQNLFTFMLLYLSRQTPLFALVTVCP